MDAGGGGGGGAGVSAPAASNGSFGLVRTVVGYSTTALFFWLLTIALVAAIHIASVFSKPSSSRADDKEKEREKEKARRDRLAAAEARETSGRGDDRVLEMMRSFSFVQATEEDFMEGMSTTAYEYNGVDADAGAAHGPAAPEPPFAPSPALTATTAASLSFRFQHQMSEVPTEAAELGSREFTTTREEAAVAVSREFTAAAREAEDERERGEEKESSLALLQSAVPVMRRKNENEAEEEAEFVVEDEEVEEQSREVVQEAAAPPTIVATTHNYQFLTERDFRGFVREPEAMTVRVQESFMPPPPSPPSRHQPEERRVVDVSSRSGRFLTERDFRPANEPDVCESVASSGKRTPSLKPKPASSPAVDARMSFASEFSGFGDSDTESSASDGYSVKDLVVDSDSDWFLSEKDFPATARDSGNLKSYKAKVLKAIEALEVASKLEPSYQDSATTVSPGSVRPGSPDTIPDGSPKFPEDMWSRSPSPDVEYKEEDDEKVTREAEAQYDEDIEQRSTAEEEGGIDMSDDDEHS